MLYREVKMITRADKYCFSAILLFSICLIFSVGYDQSQSRKYTDKEREQYSQAHANILKNCEILSTVRASHHACKRFQDLELPESETAKPSPATIFFFFLMVTTAVTRVGLIIQHELTSKAKGVKVA